MTRHLAIIPARKNSKGLKFKNRILFDNTVKFLKKLEFIDKVIVSSDDRKILSLGKKNNYLIHKRKNFFAKDNTSIRSTLKNIVSDLSLKKTDIIWLIYLPIINKDYKDYKKAYKITQKKNFKSMCTFFEGDYKFHPYYSYKIQNNIAKKTIINKIFRRQDLPKIYYHFHYICCLKVIELNQLDSELINKKTFPIKMSFNTFKMTELDSKKDLKNFYKY